MRTGISRSARIAALSLTLVLAIGWAVRAADTPPQPSDRAETRSEQPAQNDASLPAVATETPIVYPNAATPIVDLDAYKPECAPYVSKPVSDHSVDLANAPVENCDIREVVLSEPDVEGPKKKPVAPPLNP